MLTDMFPFSCCCSEGRAEAPGPGGGDGLHVLRGAARRVVRDEHLRRDDRRVQAVCLTAGEHHLHGPATLPHAA